MTTQQIVRLALLVLSWTVLLVRSRAVLSPRQRPLWLALLALAVEILLLQEAVAAAVIRASGVPNMDVFLGGFCHVAMMSILWSIASAASPGSPRWSGRRLRHWLTASTVTVMLVTEVLSTMAAEGTRSRALPLSAAQDVITVGWVAYLFFLTIASADSGRRLWRYGRTASFGALRLSIVLLCLGCGASIVYVVGRVATIVDGTEPGSPSAMLVMFASMTYFLCLVLGCATVVVAPIVNAVRAWWQRCRLFRLWRSLTEVVPGIVLEPTPSLGHDLLRVRRNAVRLQRRVIEIRDAAITLREWVTSEQVAAVTAETDRQGLTGMAAAGAITARCLALGRAAKLAGAPRATEVPAVATSGGEDIDGEVRWLAAVRAHYRETGWSSPRIKA